MKEYYLSSVESDDADDIKKVQLTRMDIIYLLVALRVTLDHMHDRSEVPAEEVSAIASVINKLRNITR